MSLWYSFVLQLAKGAYGLLGGVRTTGRENVPKSGPVILAPIHLSHLDPPLMAIACRRQLRFMAKEELFTGLLKPLITSLGAFPVKRGEGDTEAIRLAMSLLEKGEVVLIFPEGTRGDGTRLLPLNKGIPMIAKRTGATVVPASIVGTHIAWPRGRKKLKRSRMNVRFGQPFTYADIATHPTERENRAAFLDRLSDEIRALRAEDGLNLSREPGQSLPDES